MKVSHIVKLCKDLANLDLPQNCYVGAGQDYTQSPVAQTLYHAMNFVLEDIYCNYATALQKTVVVASNNVVDTTNLQLNRVVSLTDGSGNDVSFRYTERGLFVEVDGSYNLVYAKLPPKLDWQGSVVLPSPRITPRIFTYGVLAEYFSAIGDLQNAERYKEKYLDGLKIATRKVSGITMPARRWW